MHEKSVHKISVAEIVRKADISRATFYLHYLDIYDLLQKTEDDIISGILDEIAKFDESTYVVGEFPIARRVFEVMHCHSDKITTLIGENGDFAFREKFQAALKDYFKNLLTFIATKPEMLEPVLSFLIGGVLDMFLENLKKEIPADITTLSMVSNRYLRVTNALIGLPEVEPD